MAMLIQIMLVIWISGDLRQVIFLLSRVMPLIRRRHYSQQ